MTVRDGRLSVLPQPNWEEGRHAVRHTFGLHASHFFGASGHEWLSLTETQTTGGLAHFLDSADSGRRDAGVGALFAAAGVPLRDAIAEARVAAEYPITGGRLDLLAWVRTVVGTTFLLIVEGKFEYDLSRDQLRRYERALTSIVADEELGDPLVTLRVVGTRVSGRSRKQLARHQRWSFLSWRTLLLQLERNLPISADDHDFRRFRRTLWDRCK